MRYNFHNEPSPSLYTEIDPNGTVQLTDGLTQGDLLTERFSGSNVQVSIVPPRGWSLDTVVWSDGSGGLFSVPAPGSEQSSTFSFTVSQDGTSLTGNGSFKVKKKNGEHDD